MRVGNWKFIRDIPKLVPMIRYELEAATHQIKYNGSNTAVI